MPPTRPVFQRLAYRDYLATGAVGLVLYLAIGLWVLHASIDTASTRDSSVRDTAWLTIADGGGPLSPPFTESPGGSLNEYARRWTYGLVAVTILLVAWLLYGLGLDHHHRLWSRSRQGSRVTRDAADRRGEHAPAPAGAAIEIEVARDSLQTFTPITPDPLEDECLSDTGECDHHEAPRGIDRIRTMNARQLAAALVRERSQTVALLLTQLEPGQAAQVMAQLSPERQTDVTRRGIVMDDVSQDLLEAVLEELAGRPAELRPRRLTRSDGMSGMARIMRSLDRDTARGILQRLESADAQAAAQLKSCMFSFADVARLDDTALRRLLMEVSTQDIAMALADASDEVKCRVLSQVSSRVASIIREEMSYVGPLQAVETRAAQRQIVDTVLRLEAEEQIERSLPPQVTEADSARPTTDAPESATQRAAQGSG